MQNVDTRTTKIINLVSSPRQAQTLRFQFFSNPSLITPADLTEYAFSYNLLNFQSLKPLTGGQYTPVPLNGEFTIKIEEDNYNIIRENRVKHELKIHYKGDDFVAVFGTWRFNYGEPGPTTTINPISIKLPDETLYVRITPFFFEYLGFFANRAITTSIPKSTALQILWEFNADKAVTNSIPKTSELILSGFSTAKYQTNSQPKPGTLLVSGFSADKAVTDSIPKAGSLSVAGFMVAKAETNSLPKPGTLLVTGFASVKQQTDSIAKPATLILSGFATDKQQTTSIAKPGTLLTTGFASDKAVTDSISKPAEFVIPVISVWQFNFNATAQSIEGWEDVSGNPHTATRTGTQNGVTFSTGANTNWNAFAGLSAYNDGGEDVDDGGGFVFPAAVTRSTIYSRLDSLHPVLTVSGLDDGETYQVDMLPSYDTGLNNDNTDFQTWAIGGVERTVNGRSNTSELLSWTGVSPSSGVITITATDLVSAEDQFYIIAGIRITQE